MTLKRNKAHSYMSENVVSSLRSLTSTAHDVGAWVCTLARHRLSWLHTLAPSWVQLCTCMGSCRNIGAWGIYVEGHKTPWLFPGEHH